LCLNACDSGSIDTAASSASPGATSVANQATAPAPNQVPTSPDTASFQDRVLTLTNQFRAANGVAPLALNGLLAKSAQDYAVVMASVNVMSHTGPDGSDPGSRITAAGYSWSTWGENIAEGYTTPEAVVNGWINSPEHRANMLNAAFHEIGVGYAMGTSPYWVQDFGSP
jgi:uncharacterized protein YkwD